MKYLFSFLLVLSILLAGCTTLEQDLAPPMTFKVDKAFVSNAPFQESAGKWNLFTTSEKQITFSDTGVWTILSEDPGDGYNGVTIDALHIIKIKPGSDPYFVSIHELGHALGLHHTATGVMDPLHASDDFTEEVLKECQNAAACPL